jgi:hypothetical protein
MAHGGDNVANLDVRGGNVAAILQMSKKIVECGGVALVSEFKSHPTANKNAAN